MNVDQWIAHFAQNRENRLEPNWQAPIRLSPDVVPTLLKSLAQFQLGDGGGPACLIAWNAAKFCSPADGMDKVVDLWFREEREHSRLLEAAVARFGGRCIKSHWSFTAFCLARRLFGVQFELTVLLLTEIVSTVYYLLLLRHAPDEALRSMCRLILRDEAGHVRFHHDRLVNSARKHGTRHGRIWAARFRMLGLGAASMLWVNHAGALRALGATRSEFYREVCRGLARFIRRLRQERELAEGNPRERWGVAPARLLQRGGA